VKKAALEVQLLHVDSEPESYEAGSKRHWASEYVMERFIGLMDDHVT